MTRNSGVLFSGVNIGEWGFGRGIFVSSDERGNVSEAQVVKRYLVNKDKTERTFVQEIGYGVEEAALAAAGRWMFRPAREGGKIVRSYTTLTFSFGV